MKRSLSSLVLSWEIHFSRQLRTRQRFAWLIEKGSHQQVTEQLANGHLWSSLGGSGAMATESYGLARFVESREKIFNGCTFRRPDCSFLDGFCDWLTNWLCAGQFGALLAYQRRPLVLHLASVKSLYLITDYIYRWARSHSVYYYRPYAPRFCHSLSFIGMIAYNATKQYRRWLTQISCSSYTVRHY